MLILSRRVGDSVTIGDEITVKVLSTRGSLVRIAIHAPKEVLVHREEIYYKIQQEESSCERIPDQKNHL